MAGITMIKSGSFAIISGLTADVISGIMWQIRGRSGMGRAHGVKIVGFDYNKDMKCLIMYKL